MKFLIDGVQNLTMDN